MWPEGLLLLTLMRKAKDIRLKSVFLCIEHINFKLPLETKCIEA